MQATKERGAVARIIKAKRILQLRDGGLSRIAIARSTGMLKQSVRDVADPDGAAVGEDADFVIGLVGLSLMRGVFTGRC
ncbi:MAG: hypothetical protein ACI4OC_00865 [Coriobacteriales bacterium]